MKTKMFFFAAALCMAVCNTSCSTDDEEITYNKAVNLPSPQYAAQAASYTIASGVPATEGNTHKLTAVNITESGKAIIEVTASNGSKKYVTYKAAINGDTFTLTDSKGAAKGTIKALTTKATTTNVNITLTLTVEIPGMGALTFNANTPVTAQKAIEEAASVAMTNIARTWKVVEMKLTLEGDVSASINEKSGNLGAFVKEAQDRGAGLTQKEIAELQKTIYGITLDKSGLFSIEYSNNAGTEACSWKWTDEAQSKLQLELRNSEFGNKFLSNGSSVDVRFFESGVCHFIMTTNITGNKNYTATLLMVLEQEK